MLTVGNFSNVIGEVIAKNNLKASPGECYYNAVIIRISKTPESKKFN